MENPNLNPGDQFTFDFGGAFWNFATTCVSVRPPGTARSYEELLFKGWFIIDYDPSPNQEGPCSTSAAGQSDAQMVTINHATVAGPAGATSQSMLQAAPTIPRINAHANSPPFSNTGGVIPTGVVTGRASLGAMIAGIKTLLDDHPQAKPHIVDIRNMLELAKRMAERL